MIELILSFFFEKRYIVLELAASPRAAIGLLETPPHHPESQIPCQFP
jgi:hypothetical protein